MALHTGCWPGVTDAVRGCSREVPPAFSRMALIWALHHGCCCSWPCVYLLCSQHKGTAQYALLSQHPRKALINAGRFALSKVLAEKAVSRSKYALQVVTSFKAHEKNVRALQYNADSNLLLTGSFDRTLGVYRAG